MVVFSSNLPHIPKQVKHKNEMKSTLKSTLKLSTKFITIEDLTKIESLRITCTPQVVICVSLKCQKLNMANLCTLKSLNQFLKLDLNILLPHLAAKRKKS